MIELILEDLCTRCGACEAACPTHVFDLGPTGVPVIARQEQCQTCFMCELYCEADALYVGPDQRGPQPVDLEIVRASGELGRLRRDYGWASPADLSAPHSEVWRLGPLLMEGAQIAARRYADKHPERPPAALGRPVGQRWD